MEKHKMRNTEERKKERKGEKCNLRERKEEEKKENEKEEVEKEEHEEEEKAGEEEQKSVDGMKELKFC